MKPLVIALLCFLCSALASPAEDYQTVDTVWAKKYGPSGQIRFSPDGNFLYATSASGPGRPQKLDALTGNLIQEYDVMTNNNPFFSLDLSKDGTLLASGTSPLLSVYDAVTGALLKSKRIAEDRRDGYIAGAFSIALSADNRYLAYNFQLSQSDNYQNNVQLWDMQTDSVSFLLANRNTHHVKFSPTRNILAMAGDQGEFDIFDLDSNKLIFNQKFPESEIKDISFSPDGSLLALAFYSGSIKIIDMNTLQIKIDIPKAHAIALNGNVMKLSFLDNNSLLSNGFDFDGNDFINFNIKWDLTTKEKLYKYLFGYISDINYNKQYNMLAFSSSSYLFAMKNQIRTGINDNILIGSGFQIIPNPIKNRSMIKFNLLLTGKLSIEILDVNSNIVDIISPSLIKQGQNSIDYEPKNLPSGTYFCRLKTGTTTRTIKFQIAR